jgi:transposase
MPCEGDLTRRLHAAGITPHLAEPPDTAALRGKKRHTKTDKTDTRHLRVHLMAGDLPECWILAGACPGGPGDSPAV